MAGHHHIFVISFLLFNKGITTCAVTVKEPYCTIQVSSQRKHLVTLHSWSPLLNFGTCYHLMPGMPECFLNTNITTRHASSSSFGPTNSVPTLKFCPKKAFFRFDFLTAPRSQKTSPRTTIIWLSECVDLLLHFFCFSHWAHFKFPCLKYCNKWPIKFKVVFSWK